MTIDLDVYSKQKAFVQNWFKSKNYPIGYAISMSSVMTMIPVIVCAYWIGEASGWQQESLDKILKIKEFYGYTRIDGKPPGAPL